MAEEQIWTGHSSQWKNLAPNAFTLITLGIAIWLHNTQPWGHWAYLVPALGVVWALWSLLVIKNTTYHLTTERLVTKRGIFTKVTDTLELYRVRDLQIVQPLALRMLGLENIHLIASDVTTNAIVIDYLPANLHLGEKLRKVVEDCREKKRVRAFDMVGEEGQGGGDVMPLG